MVEKVHIFLRAFLVRRTDTTKCTFGKTTLGKVSRFQTHRQFLYLHHGNRLALILLYLDNGTDMDVEHRIAHGNKIRLNLVAVLYVLWLIDRLAIIRHTYSLGTQQKIAATKSWLVGKSTNSLHHALANSRSRLSLDASILIKAIQ